VSHLIKTLHKRVTCKGDHRSAYIPQEEYVLDHGLSMISGEPLSSEQYEYLKLIGASIDHAPKQCFHNAQLLTLHSSWNEVQPDRIQYHEGYVWTGLIPILHAWVTLDGKIVDTTLSTDPNSTQRWLNGEPPQEDLRDRVLGVIPEGWEYLGVPMDTEYVTSQLLKNMESRSLIDNWQDNWPLLRKT